jgi:hypothetical protein
MLYFLRQVIQRPNDDDVIWTWPVDGPPPTPGLLGALIDRWQTSYLAWMAQINFSPMSWVLLEAMPAAGGPALAVQTVSPAFAIGTGTTGPAEVQLALSREVLGTRGQTPAGRVFLGPMSTQALGWRPTTTLINNSLSFGKDLHNSWAVEGVDMVVISRQQNNLPIAPVARPIVAYSVDNAWDTQRRRGSEPTSRTTVTVP